MGGRGAFGLDFRLPGLFQTIRGFVAPDGSDGGYDLKLEFGAPRASPEGNAEHYWTAALMPNSELAAAIGSTRLGDGQELGTYTMRLSNHVGLDRNLEDPDDPAAYVRDDVNHYLSYAAYGHMEFFDSFVTPATNLIPERRTFPFHAGYDAFKDEAGMRTTDVAEADKITGGTFRGQTFASQFAIACTGPAGFYPSLTGAHSLTLRDANYLRLRGDVTLTATISGTAADNRINGKITNLESFSNSERIWEDYDRISGDLTLQATGISASGRFVGVIPTPPPAAIGLCRISMREATGGTSTGRSPTWRRPESGISRTETLSLPAIDCRSWAASARRSSARTAAKASRWGLSATDLDPKTPGCRAFPARQLSFPEHALQCMRSAAGRMPPRGRARNRAWTATIL